MEGTGQEHVYGTPITQVTFRVDGADKIVNNVVSRRLYGSGPEAMVILRDSDGGFHGFRNWSSFSQTPGRNLFE